MAGRKAGQACYLELERVRIRTFTGPYTGSYLLSALNSAFSQSYRDEAGSCNATAFSSPGESRRLRAEFHQFARDKVV